MKRAIFLAAVLTCSLAMFGQEGMPLQIFGGYQHMSNYSVGQSGWIATANYDFSHWLGLEGDLSGAYGTQNLGTVAVILPNVPNGIHSRLHMFTAGPRVTYRPASSDKWNAFGHLLFGYAHTNVSASGTGQSASSFAWGLGGGAKYFFTQHIGGQAQFDEMRTNFFSHGDWHPRIALGVVYRFGTK
jgi:hypothetical protein